MPDQHHVYVLIGGGGGQGAAAARRLASCGGCKLVIAGRDESKLSPLADELGAEAHALDAADFSALEELLNNTAEKHGRIDGVANLAGNILIKPVHMVTEAEYEQTMDLNVRTAFSVVRAASKVMSKQKHGSIVLMSSCAARIGLHSHEAIAAAKGAVIGLMQSAAASLASSGVRVNCVAPGLVDTPMAKRITGSEQGRKASEAMHPLGRIGTPDDTAPAIAWLLGPESAWVTGQVIGVDGGLSALKGKA